MNVAIRVDSSERIGAGHLARCLALADALRSRGAVVLFVCRSLPGDLSNLVRRSGFELISLEQPSESVETGEPTFWLGGITGEQDADECLRRFADLGRNIDWLVADNYGVDVNWERRLRPRVGRLAVIDDLANRDHDCDLLIDPNLQSEELDRYSGRIPFESLRLIGPQYALLRDEFAKQRGTLRVRDGVVRRILIFFGGTDPTNETSKALDAIRSLERDDLELDVVVGATAPHRASVHERCALDPHIRIHEQTNQMARLLRDADLAIGAGGTSMWERCAMGIPSIVIAVADNQVPASEMMNDQGRAFYIGRSCEVTVSELSRILSGVLQIPQLLRSMSSRSAKLVDGGGARRVAGIMCAPDIRLRAAGPCDCKLLYEWRNDPDSLRNSHNSALIRYETHEGWFSRTLSDGNRVLLIAEAEQQCIGVLRYDLHGSHALVSINLAPGWRGRGLGAWILQIGARWLARNRPGLHEIRAEILPANRASQTIFKQAGYQPGFSTLKHVLKAEA